MLTYEITDSHGFAVVRLEGLVSLDAWDAVLQEISAALATRDGPRRLLIDIMSTLGYLGIPERRAVGAMMGEPFAELGGAFDRAAIVARRPLALGERGRLGRDDLLGGLGDFLNGRVIMAAGGAGE